MGAALREVSNELDKFRAVMAGRLKDERAGRVRRIKGKPPRPLFELVLVGQRLLGVAEAFGFNTGKHPGMREAGKLVEAGAEAAYHQYLLSGRGGRKAMEAFPTAAKQKAALEVADAITKRIAGNQKVHASIVRRVHEAVGGEKFERMVAFRKARRTGLSPRTTKLLTKTAFWRRHR